MEGQSQVSQEKTQNRPETNCEELLQGREGDLEVDWGVGGGGLELEAECKPWGSEIWERRAGREQAAHASRVISGKERLRPLRERDQEGERRSSLATEGRTWKSGKASSS